MKITILCGSSRKDSQSGKVARYLQQELEKKHGQTTYLLNLAGNPLPIWDESIFSHGETWQKVWDPIKAELQSSDGFVFVVPEWNGMAPSAVMNFFQLCSAQELGHKPGLIVTVSATFGGAFPVAELRQVSYKNSRISYLPEHVIIRNVGTTFNGPEPENEADAYLRDRATYGLKLLIEYAKALDQVRSSGVIDWKKYANGMS